MKRRTVGAQSLACAKSLACAQSIAWPYRQYLSKKQNYRKQKNHFLSFKKLFLYFVKMSPAGNFRRRRIFADFKPGF
jgi:hypothetical protein